MTANGNMLQFAMCSVTCSIRTVVTECIAITIIHIRWSIVASIEKV